MKTAVLSFAVAACLALASPALGDEPSAPDAQTKALAMQRYEQGEAAFGQGRYKDAIDLFLAADRLVEHPAFPYNIAVAYEEMGDVASALRWAREFLHRTPDAANQAEVRERIARYQARLMEKGVQQVTVRSTPTGATVLVDGRPVGVTPWTGELLPGSHGVELRLDGHDRAQETFDLPAAEAITVSLELAESAPTPDAPAVAPLPTPGPVGGDEGDSPVLWPWAAAVGGVGLAGVGAAVALEVMRSGKNADAEAAATQTEAADLAAQSEDLQLGARIALGVGAGLVAVGATLLVVDLVSGDGGGDALALGCGPGGCRLTWRGDL